MTRPGPIIPVFAGSSARLLTFDLSPTADPLNSSITDLVEFVGERDPQAISGWRELSREEYSRSFAVAQTAGSGVIRDIYDAFQVSVQARETESEFSDRVLPILRAKGWLGSPSRAAARLQLIYDTNLRLARARGRWERIRRTSAALPYMRAVTARDERVRHPPGSKSDHTAWDGIVLRTDHPFWTRWFPPLGFRCRCSVIQMTRSQFARLNSGLTSEADLEEREARLGEQIFATPGFAQQLAGIAAAHERNRLPGGQGLNMNEVRSTGSRLLEAKLIDEGLEELAETLNRIFGRDT